MRKTLRQTYDYWQEEERLFDTRARVGCLGSCHVPSTHVHLHVSMCRNPWTEDIDYLPEKGVDYSDCDVPTQLSAEIVPGFDFQETHRRQPATNRGCLKVFL